MTQIRYISADGIIWLNARALRDTGEPIQVRDEAGLKSLVGRPEHTFAGVDVVPDLIGKAALYMHGLASTQVFAQGNKRTAWATTDMFLKVNGVTLRDTPVVAREAMLIATAIKEAKDFDVDKVAEWLREHTLKAADHLVYAALGTVSGQDGTNFSDLHYQFPSAILGVYPGENTISYGLLNEIVWLPPEIGSEHAIRMEFTQTEGPPCQVVYELPDRYTATVASVPAAPWAPKGVQHWTQPFVFSIHTSNAIKGLVRLLIDGEPAWQQHVTITVTPPPSSDERFSQWLANVPKDNR